MGNLTPDEANALKEFLRGVPLLAEVTDEELAAIISVARREEYHPGDRLFRQGDADNTLYIIAVGEVRLLHLDVDGVINDVGTRGPGEMLGESSLLLGEPHDVTARVLEPVTAITFTRGDFQPLLDDWPRLLAHLSPTEEVALRLRVYSQHRYKWQSSEEQVVLFVRQHYWALVRASILPLLVAVIVLGIVKLMADSSPALIPIATVVGGIAFIVTFGYVFIDWRNDYYVVTSRRIVHIDEILFVRKKRQEAPLPSITGIQYVRAGFMAATLDFGNLEVDTFTGTIGMQDIPSPDKIRETILREVEKMQTRARATERRKIRDDLSKRLVSHDVPVAPPPEIKVTDVTRRPSVFSGVFRYFFPKLTLEVGDTIIWHKHWIILWRTAVWPTLALFFVLLGMGNWYSGAAPLGTLLEDSAWWVWPVVLGVTVGWWLWAFEDWRNDEYMLTANHIVEIERLPFLLNEKRKEFKLSNFQSTEVKIVGPMQRIFHYGTLIIKVPGSSISFNYIQDPAGAQAEFTRRLALYNRRQADKEAQARTSELVEWFAAYDQVHEDRQSKERREAAARQEKGQS